MNKRGQFGIINSTGKPGDPSELIDCRDEGFLANIEDGILDTVVAVLNKDLFTVSSCEGHAVTCPYRCVSIINELPVIRWLQQAIYEINNHGAYQKPILYYLLPYQETCGLYAGYFDRPFIIDIIFGNYQEDETILKQHAFEKYLRENAVGKIDTDLPGELTCYRKSSGDHIDVYTHTD